MGNPNSASALLVCASCAEGGVCEHTSNQALVWQIRQNKEQFISAVRGKSFPRFSGSLQSDRGASVTSTRAARAAGSTDATTAAVSSTTTDTTTGRLPGICTSSK